MSTAIALWMAFGAGVVLYGVWALPHIAAGGNPWWYAAGALLVYAAVLLAFVTLWFAVAWIHRAPRPAAMRIGIVASVRLFLGEFRAIARSGPRMALYRWLLRDPPPQRALLPVLLVHGVLCNAGAMAGLRSYLAARNIGPLYTLSYGPPLAPIDSFAEQLAAKIDGILKQTGAGRVAVVAHSMGGLVGRAYMRCYGTDKLATLITIGSPHHGSVHARLFPGACLEQMRPGSRWLGELNRDESTPDVRVVSIWSWHDSMVAPQTSARLAGATNIELRGVGHNALLGDRDVHAAVAAELEQTRATMSRHATAEPAAARVA